MQSIRIDVSQGIKPSKIWLKHLNPMNTAESARSYRQVIDAKSKHNREVLGIRGNTCDDIIKIITERQYKLKNSIQRTFGATRERKIPSVACWRDWHMHTIPNVCRWDTLGVILGEDITFNLVSHDVNTIHNRMVKDHDLITYPFIAFFVGPRPCDDNCISTSISY